MLLRKMNTKNQGLSDLLDTHQVQPTEVKTPKQGKDHHHSLEDVPTCVSRKTQQGKEHFEAGVKQTNFKRSSPTISL
jgi:hypothetical protein